MGNILTYLEEHGSEIFRQAAFNTVDNLVLSCLAYVDLAGFMPKRDSDNFITVEDASRAFFAKHEEEELLKDRSLLKMTPFVLKHMAESERFKHARLSHFEDQLCPKEIMQFAATLIELDDGTAYVAFRGTDNRLLSWHEDFNLSFSSIPSQHEAAGYLGYIMTVTSRDLRVGGHSKGGNLAVYAAAKLPDHQKTRVLKVYNNDGPGFDKAFLSSAGYQSIRPKVLRIVPEFALIGTLFEHDDDLLIVKSSEADLMQHDAITWQVSGHDFAVAERIDDTAVFIAQALKTWLKTMDREQREVIVSNFFTALDNSDVEYLTDLMDVKPETVAKLLKNWQLMRVRIRPFLESVYATFSSTARNNVEAWLQDTTGKSEKLQTLQALPQKTSQKLGSWFHGAKRQAGKMRGLRTLPRKVPQKLESWWQSRPLPNDPKKGR